MKDWLLSIVWYASLVATLAGSLAIVRPLPRLSLPTRPHGAVLLAIAVLLLTMNALMAPATQRRSSTEAIDRLMPAFQFQEVHSRTIDAAVERVWPAVNEVTAGEIALFRTFTAIRRMGRGGADSILNPPADEPIMAVATRSGFRLLAKTETEIVLGTIVANPPGGRPPIDFSDPAWFAKLAAPGIVKAVLNFRVEPDGAGATRLTTETRVFAVDGDGLRRFTPYWRTIFPGSSILRVTWLRAIARRAER
jgi:hypothetical protein